MLHINNKKISHYLQCLCACECESVYGHVHKGGEMEDIKDGSQMVGWKKELHYYFFLLSHRMFLNDNVKIS